MMFNAQTIIEPICVEAQGTGPEYLNIAAIPRVAGLYDRFGVKFIKCCFAYTSLQCSITNLLLLFLVLDVLGVVLCIGNVVRL